MLAVLILQFMEGLPDRKAVEACTYDLRWKMALGMESDEAAFHATSLVKFRNRLLKHNLLGIGFDAVLGAMRKAGYLKAHKAQRLDSTHVVGLVSHMSRLECVRETIRLALEVLEQVPQEELPEIWPTWWERYVQSSVDFKTDIETLKEKMIQAGKDIRALLAWIDSLGSTVAQLKSVTLLRRVYEENFLEADGHLEPTRVQKSGSVRNPHDPDAQWSTKGTIPGKTKEWVGYKTQVAETVPTAVPGSHAPTDAVITAIVTQPAITSDHGSINHVEDEWEREGLEKPSDLYVDGDYTSGEVLAKAAEENRQVHGPIQAAPQRGDRYSVDDFDVDINKRVTICPDGKASTNCSRLEECTGKINCRFEWNNGLCQSCQYRERCLGADQGHRTLIVGQHHEHTQARRRDMKPMPSVSPRWSAPRGSLLFAQRYSSGRKDLERGERTAGDINVFLLLEPCHTAADLRKRHRIAIVVHSNSVKRSAVGIPERHRCRASSPSIPGSINQSRHRDDAISRFPMPAQEYVLPCGQ
jgi:hypothetical protein